MNKQSYFSGIDPKILREMNYLRLIKIHNDPNSFLCKKQIKNLKILKNKIDNYKLVKLSKSI